VVLIFHARRTRYAAQSTLTAASRPAIAARASQRLPGRYNAPRTCAIKAYSHVEVSGASNFSFLVARSGSCLAREGFSLKSEGKGVALILASFASVVACLRIFASLEETACRIRLRENTIERSPLLRQPNDDNNSQSQLTTCEWSLKSRVVPDTLHGRDTIAP